MLTSFIAVDTETTGLDFEHDRIIELAAVRFENGKPTETFSALISPGERVPSAVSRLITGITDDELRDAPPTADTLRAFLAFAGDSPLVAHNAEFDAHFVRRALESESLPPLPGVWLDSLLLTRIAWPTWESHRLDSLAERLNVPRDAEHRALPDARRAGFVFLAAQEHLHRTMSATGWNDLARLSTTLSDWSLVFTTREEDDQGADASLDAAASQGVGLETSGVSAEESPHATIPAGEGFVVDAHTQSEARTALTEHVASTFASENWLVLETPVGLDENAAALEAALEYLRGSGMGQRVLLAVPDNYAWNALRKLPSQTNVRIAALAEPSGYLNRARLHEINAQPARVPLEERAALLPLVAWADRCGGAGPGPVADGRGFSPERARQTWMRVQCESWNDDPAARKARDIAASSGLILITHATLCAHVASEGALLPACDAVLVTGAHRFPDTAQSPSGEGRIISLFRLRETLRLLRAADVSDISDVSGVSDSSDASTASDPTEGSQTNEAGGTTEDTRASGLWIGLEPHLDQTLRDTGRTTWFAADRELQKFLQKAGKQAGKISGNDFKIRYTESLASAFTADPEPVRSALQANEAFLAAAESVLTDRPGTETLLASLRSIVIRLRAFREDFNALCEASDQETVYWLEDGANVQKTTLRAVPRAMEPFGSSLRALFGAGVFLSPAVIAGGHVTRDARSFLRAAGLWTTANSGEADVTVRRINADAPPFLMTPFAPAPASGNNAGEQMEAYARFLVDAAGPFAAQGVLIFCPSQTAVRALYGALRNALKSETESPITSPDARSPETPAPASIPILAQWIDGNRDAITRLYAAGRGGFVIATEGLPGLRDADGHAPALWLLTRMPLPPPREPLLEARGEPMREEGKNARLELWHPAAILRVKREWAMLHREGGVGPKAVWLLDARAATEGLGVRLGEALGAKPEVVRSIEELKEKTRGKVQ